MVDEDLKNQIGIAIAEKRSLDVLREVLCEFQRSGGKQKDALETLQSMREGASDAFEDRVLEVMDFASEWCQPHRKIWS